MVAQIVPYAVPDVGWEGTSTKQLFFLFQFYTIVVQNRNFDFGSV